MEVKTLLRVLGPGILFLAVAASAQPPERIKFSTPVKTSVHGDLPMLAAEERGFWKQQGLDVEWVAFTGGRDQWRAVAAGSINIGTGTAASIIQSVTRGIPMFMVADLKLTNDMMIWVKADSPIQRPRDLKGKKVAVPALGAIAHFYGIAAAKELGLEKDIKFIGGGGVTANIAGLRAGVFDGVLLTQFVMAALKYEGEVKDLLNMRDYLPKEWVDNVLFSRRDFTGRFPEVVKKVIAGYFSATDFIVNNSAWTIEKMKSHLGYSDKAARGIFPLLNFGKDGRLEPKGVENVLKFLVEYDLISKDKAPPLGQLYSNDFLG